MSLNATRVLPKFNTLSRSYATAFRLYEKMKGNREQVGWGGNGLPHYKDIVHVPFPAVRYLPDTPDVLALREREKEDWRNLTLEEKKQLYRNSFRHTFAELNAPRDNFCHILGCLFLFYTFGISFYLFVREVINGYEIDPMLSEESHKLYVKRFLDEEKDPIWGISSMWDYEKKEWKK